MSSLQLVDKTYHICFRFAGHRFKRSLGTGRIDIADARRVRLDETIRLVKSGRLELPEDTDDVASFLLADGRPKPKPPVVTPKPTHPPRFTLKQAFAEFFAAIPDGNLEESTLGSMNIHKNHLLKIIGSGFVFPELTVKTLQGYVNRRCRQKARTGKRISSTTIKKELGTLRTVWRWAAAAKKVTGDFPRRGLRLPKSSEPLVSMKESILLKRSGSPIALGSCLIFPATGEPRRCCVV